MTAAVIILAATVAGLAALLWHRSIRGLLASRTRRRVIVTLKTGEAFSGLLFASDRDAVVLREAVALEYGPKAENVPVEGEALILRVDVAYIQLP